MKILYFDEKRSKKYWDALRSKKTYEGIVFESINGLSGRPTAGLKLVCFIHFKARGEQAKFEEDFNFHILGRDYEVPDDATVLFGPDRPHPILKMDFNTFIRKHKEEFKDADMVIIKRNDKVNTTSLHSYNACKQFLDRRLNLEHKKPEESTPSLPEERQP